MKDHRRQPVPSRPGARDGYFATRTRLAERGRRPDPSGKRTAERKPLQLAVYLLGHCAIPARTVDISANGVLVEIDADSGLGCNLGTLAQSLRTLGCEGLRLEFRDLAIHVGAETVRVTSGTSGELRAAFRFSGPVPPALQRLLERHR